MKPKRKKEQRNTVALSVAAATNLALSGREESSSKGKVDKMIMEIMVIEVVVVARSTITEEDTMTIIN